MARITSSSGTSRCAEPELVRKRGGGRPAERSLSWRCLHGRRGVLVRGHGGHGSAQRAHAAEFDGGVPAQQPEPTPAHALVLWPRGSWFAHGAPERAPVARRV